MADIASMLATPATSAPPPTSSAPTAPATEPLTPEAAEAEIAAIRYEPTHRCFRAFNTAGHPHRDKALEYLQKLYAAKNGASGGAFFVAAGLSDFVVVGAVLAASPGPAEGMANARAIRRAVSRSIGGCSWRRA